MGNGAKRDVNGDDNCDCENDYTCEDNDYDNDDDEESSIYLHVLSIR